MPHILWQKNYEVGIPPIDEQHQRLVEMISRLEDSLDEKVGDLGGPIVGQILKELVEYARYHFKFEEEFLAQMKYSQVADHHRHHQRLLGEIREKLLELRAGGELTKIDMVLFLKHWLVDHILAEDKKFGQELRRKILLAKRPV